RVGGDQLRRLERLLTNLGPGARILVTHYPVGDAQGRPERPWHLLRNLADLLATAERGGVCLWLHGHRHEAYVLDNRRVAPFPVICAGSATQVGHWGYNEYVIDGVQLHAQRRCFDPTTRSFRDAEEFDLRLPDSAG